MKLTVHESA